MGVTKFIQLFSEILDETDVNSLNEGTQFRDLEEWGSLTSLSLIAMVDEEYNVKITGEDIKTSHTLGEIFSIINSRL